MAQENEQNTAASGDGNNCGNNIDNGNEDNSSLLRIKNVTEINSAITNGPSISSASSSESERTGKDGKLKRKLPFWLDPNCTGSNSKKKNISSHPAEDENENSAEAENITVKKAEDFTLESVQAESTVSQSELPQVPQIENSQDDMDANEATPKDVKVKIEPTNDVTSPGTSTNEQNDPDTNRQDVKPVTVKQEASSSIRDSCKFGIRCYRRNPAHRAELAHPGDNDYRRPDFPLPPDGTPMCPFGDACYRRNPVHFQQYSHPPQTDFEKNRKKRVRQLRKRKAQQNQLNGSANGAADDDDEYDLLDPFINDDSDDDYIPDSDDSEESLD